jgi:hypothetical protein
VDEPRLTLEAIASTPSWSPERLNALDGSVRGALLKDWGSHIVGRWGAEALATLRAELGITVDALADAPARTDWFPVAHQLKITRYVADVFASGDLLAVERLIEQDTHRGTGKAMARWAARRVGTRRVLKSAPRLHPEGYDQGSVTVEVGRGSGMLRFRGAPFFGAPVWRTLQLFAVRGLVRYMGDTLVENWGVDQGPDGFDVGVRWR